MQLLGLTPSCVFAFYVVYQGTFSFLGAQLLHRDHHENTLVVCKQPLEKTAFLVRTAIIQFCIAHRT
jgi:hypothetical protein